MNQKRAHSFDHTRLPELLAYIGIYRNSHIAIKFSIDRKTIFYYRNKYQIKDNPNKLPIPEIVEMQIARKWNKKNEKQKHEAIHYTGDYESILSKEEERIIAHRLNCQHLVWIKKCSLCGAILESDRQINTHYQDHKNV